MPLKTFTSAKMVRSIATWFWLLCGSWALLGCATTWQPVDGTLERAGWSIQVPEGWVRLNAPGYEMLSKDGPYLQYILIQERSLDQPFRHTRRTLRSDMLPHEAAGVITDNLAADPRIMDFALVESGPVMVGERPGFQLTFTYQDHQGVPMQTRYLGTISGDRYFNLRYTATQRHYFSADRDTFQQIADSLRFPSGT